MLRMLWRAIFLVVCAVTVLLWAFVVAMWMPSYWRTDRITLGSTWKRPLEPEKSQRFYGVWIVWLSGDGGAGLALRNVSQYTTPPRSYTGAWDTSDQRAYPEPAMVSKLPSGPPPPPPPTYTEADMVLLGLVADGDSYIAYVQNVWTQQLIRLAAGHRIAGSTVVEVRGDRLVLQRDGTTTPIQVPIGNFITGAPVTAQDRSRSAFQLDMTTPLPPARLPQGLRVADEPILITTGLSTANTGTAAGQVYISYQAIPVPPPPPVAPARFLVTEVGTPFHPELKTGDMTRLLIMPYWAWMIGLTPPAGFSALALFNRFRRRWRQAGCCAICGYDLRATPDRCPECGTVVEKARA